MNSVSLTYHEDESNKEQLYDFLTHHIDRKWHASSQGQKTKGVDLIIFIYTFLENFYLLFFGIKLNHCFIRKLGGAKDFSTHCFQEDAYKCEDVLHNEVGSIPN